MPSPSSHNSLSPTGFSQGSPALQELGLKFSPAVFEVAEGDLVTPVQQAAAVVDAFPDRYSQMSQGSVELILEGALRQDISVSADPCLLGDLRGLILTARESVARMVDATLTLLYWEIGHRIHQEVLLEKRAGYGKQIVVTLSRQLEVEFGRGFSAPNLSRMIALVEAFSEREILSTLSKQLSWSHFVEILPIKDGLKRDFYAEMCRLEQWTVRTLRRKIDSMLLPPTGQRCCPKLNSSRSCTKLCSGSAPGWLTEHHQTLRPSKTMAISARFIS